MPQDCILVELWPLCQVRRCPGCHWRRMSRAPMAPTPREVRSRRVQFAAMGPSTRGLEWRRPSVVGEPSCRCFKGCNDVSCRGQGHIFRAESWLQDYREIMLRAGNFPKRCADGQGTHSQSWNAAVATTGTGTMATFVALQSGDLMRFTSDTARCLINLSIFRHETRIHSWNPPWRGPFAFCSVTPLVRNS